MPSFPPKKNATFTIILPIVDADGDLVASAATLTSVIAGADGVALLPAFAAGPVPVDETEGFYSIELTAAQMNFDRIAGVLKTTTAGAKNTPFVIYTSVAQIDDLIRATTPANTLDVNATGGVEVGSVQVGAIGAAAFAAGAIDNAAFNVTETLTANPAAGGIVAASFGAGAIDAAALAADAVDEIWDEVMTEPAQGIPSATPAFRTLLAYLYTALRNAITVTSSTKAFSNDAGTVTFKKALTDDGTTYTEAEAVAGP